VTSIVAAREALESQRRSLIVALLRIDAQIAALKGHKPGEVPVVVDACAEDDAGEADIFGGS
jgi:hypothetical protein